MAADASIAIHVPRELRQYCDSAATVIVSADTVRDALDELQRRYPVLYRGICDETDTVRRHINVFVNSAHVRDRQGLDTTLAAGDAISILPAVSGG